MEVSLKAIAIKMVSCLVVCVLSILTLNFTPDPARAADGSQFDPGYIISDELFFDAAAMNSASIQQFLMDQVQNCRAGYVCLKDYRQSTPTISDSLGRCALYSGSSSESAATIIERVGRICGISQKVLLVLLQKEQGLVTDDWPVTSQYNNATGFACPDTAPCDPAYSGFFYQVYYAARQFKTYAMFPGSYNYGPGRLNQIQYHPNRDCGISDVFIQNQATANLYIYTPYRPNAAALANLYGYGDSCSAYGNRNFWRIYTDWFGSTTDNFQAEITRKYISVGGEQGLLGPAVTDYIYESSGGGGWVRGFSAGVITYKRSTGAVILRGEFRNYFRDTGRYGGQLGWPVSDQLEISENGGGIYQTFEKASIALKSGQSAVVSVSGAFRDLFRTVSGPRGSLGWPIGNVRNVEGGTAQSFQNGLMVLAQTDSAKLVASQFADLYLQFGGIPTVGLPTSGLVTISANGGGVAQSFSNATMAQRINGGTFMISGPILQKFRSEGALSGKLGWPIGAQNCVNSQNCSQAFQGGTIQCVSGVCSTTLSTPPMPTVSGAAEIDVFAAANANLLGSSRSGFISLNRSPGGAARAFDNGTVFWNQINGARGVYEPMRGAFRKLGGIDGRLGWPTGDSDQQINGWSTQLFQGGRLFSNAVADPFVVSIDFSDLYLTQNGLQSLGRSTSGLLSISGGTGQTFRKGTILQGPNLQPYALFGPILDRYRAMGGLNSPLGWPTSAVRCSLQNVCEQSFVGGNLRSNPNGSVVLF